MKLEIRLFRFNAKHDYLPVYQPFIYRSSEDGTILDLLNHHKASGPLFLCNISKVYGVKVNGFATTLETKLADLADLMGKNLTIEPLDTSRATLDLEIDTTDFDEQFLLFSDFVDGSDSSFYNQFITHHYASKVRAIDKKYLSVAGFLLIAKLLDKNPANKPKLFEIAKKGKICSFDGTKAVFGDTKEIDETIINLQGEMGIEPKIATIFEPKKIENIEGKKLVVFSDEKIDLTSYKTAIRSSGAEVITLDPSANSGAKIGDETVAKTLASDLMNLAFDSGSDGIVCADNLSFEFLQKTFKKPLVKILCFN